MLRNLRKSGLALLALLGTWPCHAGTLRAQDGAFSLDGLVVTASPLPRLADEVAAHVTIIDAAEIRRRGDRTLGEVLRGVSGIDVVRGGSYGATTSVFARGGESDYLLVLIDGVQVNVAGGGFDFASLTTDNVERIEVLRGPASALYGSDAMTGVVHVVTRTGRGPARASGSVRAGTYGRREWAAAVEAGSSRAGYSVGLSRRETEGVLPFNNGHAGTVLSGRARLVADERTEVGMTLRFTDTEFHFPTDGSGAVVDRNSFTFGDATQLALTVERELGPTLSVEALVGLNQLDGGTDDQPDSPADTLGFFGFTSLDDFRRTSAELRAHLTLERALVTAGLEVERERQRSFTESLSQFGDSNGRSRSERSNRAGFVHASGSVGSLALGAGGRLEDNERFGRVATWQAGGSWLASRLDTRLRASLGRAIKEPTFFEAFATGFAVGNPDLAPERSDSWEIGVEQPLAGGRVTARATYFGQRFRDLIQYTFAPPEPAGPNYFNVAAATSRGVELDVGVGVGPATLELSSTWLDTEVTDAGFDSGPGAGFVEGEALLRRPERSWALRASADVAAGARVFGRVEAVGERSDRDFSTFPATPVSLPGYEVFSLGAEWSVPELGGLPRFELTVLAENLLDEQYEEVLGFRAPGRALVVGATIGAGGGR